MPHNIYKPTITALDAVVAVGESPTITLKNYRHCVLTLIAADTPSMTVKVKHSFDKNVDFGAAASPTNVWSYLELINRADQTDIVVGSTGEVISSAGVTEYAINSDHTGYIAVDVTSWTSGNLTALINGVSNQ